MCGRLPEVVFIISSDDKSTHLFVFSAPPRCFASHIVIYYLHIVNSLYMCAVHLEFGSCDRPTKPHLQICISFTLNQHGLKWILCEDPPVFNRLNMVYYWISFGLGGRGLFLSLVFYFMCHLRTAFNDTILFFFSISRRDHRFWDIWDSLHWYRCDFARVLHGRICETFKICVLLWCQNVHMTHFWTSSVNNKLLLVPSSLDIDWYLTAIS